MAFVSWSAEYTTFKDALAGMTTDQMIQSGYTDGAGQTVTFRKLDDLTKYESFLKNKAAIESNTGGRRRFGFAMGYGGAD